MPNACPAHTLDRKHDKDMNSPNIMKCASQEAKAKANTYKVASESLGRRVWVELQPNAPRTASVCRSSNSDFSTGLNELDLKFLLA